MKIIGHRGARGLAPENTVAGLQAALRTGVDGIEIDVRATADKQLVLHHNKQLQPFNRTLAIASLPFKAVKARKPDIATLSEALTTVPGQCPLFIEVKPGVDTEPVVAALKQALKSGQCQPQDLVLESFSQKTLLALHRALPDLPVLVLGYCTSLRTTYRARQLGTKMVALSHHFVWFGFVSAMHRRGYQLYVYSLNDPHKARRWERHGLAGVITDYPDRYRS